MNNENQQGLPQPENAASIMPAPTLNVPEADKQPSNEVNLEKPKLADVSDNDSVVEVSNMSKSGIEVIANRPGFYNQTRIRAGESFVISKFEDLGEWMDCKDPILQKKKNKFFKDKKAFR